MITVVYFHVLACFQWSPKEQNKSIDFSICVILIALTNMQIWCRHAGKVIIFKEGYS